MELITLTIEGMKCEMCESHICDDIRKALPEAKKVKASHRKGIATFVLEDGQDYQPAVDKIAKEGYKILDTKKEPYEKKGFFSFLKK